MNNTTTGRPFTIRLTLAWALLMFFTCILLYAAWMMVSDQWPRLTSMSVGAIASLLGYFSACAVDKFSSLRNDE